MLVAVGGHCPPYDMNENKINIALERAIDFLQRNQLPYGEFRTYRSPDKGMTSNCIFDSSLFITALVLYSLSFVPESQVREIKQKAAQFLASEAEKGGVWRYWSSRNPNHKRLPPDVDDTACVASALRNHYSPLLYKLLFGSNTQLILNNRNKQGLFYTWLGSPPARNDVDSLVNANVLSYLGDSEETKAVSDYLNQIVLKDQEEGSYLHYLNNLTLYYFISRAYFEGVSSLKASQDAIITKTISRQEENSAFDSDMNRALAICTLLNYQYNDMAVLDYGINSLLEGQREDGSWSKAALYNGYFWAEDEGENGNWQPGYWGSEELTIAFCLEALGKYKLSCSNNHV